MTDSVQNIDTYCNLRKLRMQFNVPPTRLRILSPYSNGFTKHEIDMRRKAEILKHQGPQKSTQMTYQFDRFGRPLAHEITKSVSLRGMCFLHLFTSLFRCQVKTQTVACQELKYRNGVRGGTYRIVSDQSVI